MLEREIERIEGGRKRKKTRTIRERVCIHLFPLAVLTSALHSLDSKTTLSPRLPTPSMKA